MGYASLVESIKLIWYQGVASSMISIKIFSVPICIVRFTQSLWWTYAWQSNWRRVCLVGVSLSLVMSEVNNSPSISTSFRFQFFSFALKAFVAEISQRQLRRSNASGRPASRHERRFQLTICTPNIFLRKDATIRFSCFRFFHCLSKWRVRRTLRSELLWDWTSGERLQQEADETI